MATELTHSTTATTPGPIAISFGASPIGGMNGSVELDTATSATVRMQLRTHANAGWVNSQSVVLDTVTQPIANIPVYPPYAEARWDVVAVTGGSIKLNAIGVGA